MLCFSYCEYLNSADLTENLAFVHSTVREIRLSGEGSIFS